MLGLLDILYHWMCEQYTFGIKTKYNLIHPKDEVHLFNMTETLLLMTDTHTATTSGLQTYFQQNTILGFSPSIVLGFFIAWSLRTAITMHIKTIKKQKIYFGFKQTFFVGLWATTTNLLGGCDIRCSFFICCQNFKNNIPN